MEPQSGTSVAGLSPDPPGQPEVADKDLPGEVSDVEAEGWDEVTVFDLAAEDAIPFMMECPAPELTEEDNDSEQYRELEDEAPEDPEQMESMEDIGARAYVGNDWVVFEDGPSLETHAHEAVHTMQPEEKTHAED